ncbi:MAG: PDZ domain-containing protein [Firmicutes bacterium]|nr:PDZ domain-containing protein [Bacillota bacterium]
MLLSALFGAVIGGLVVAYIAMRFLVPEQANVLPDSTPKTIFPPSNEEEIPFTERDLPEYQDTAIVRAAQKVVPTVVGITNKAKVYDIFHGRTILRDRATGSGVIISEDGYIVTNNHVIDGASEIWVTLGEEEIQAELVGGDLATDLAVLKIDKTGLPAAQFGDSDKIVVGETAIAIGNPLGLEFSQTVTVGHISAKKRTINIGEQAFNFIQTDAAINDGNSGGALVNLNGEVIGINTAKIKVTGVEGMGFAIPSNLVKSITSQLIEKGRIIRPWLGIYSGGDVDEALARQLRLPVDYGVIVQQVVPDSPAKRGGIKAGDIIIALGGKQTKVFADLREAINQHQIGEEVEVVVIRENQEVKLKVVLEEAPEELQ